MGRAKGSEVEAAPEQQVIEGMAQEKNLKVHRAALAFQDSRTALGNAREDMQNKSGKLIEVMKAEGLKFYQHGEVKVELSEVEKVKVRLTDRHEAEDD